MKYSHGWIGFAACFYLISAQAVGGSRPLVDALALHDEGQTLLAQKALRSLAADGSPEAQQMLCILYEDNFTRPCHQYPEVLNQAPQTSGVQRPLRP